MGLTMPENIAVPVRPNEGPESSPPQHPVDFGAARVGQVSPPITSKATLTVRAVAELLGVAPWTIYECLRRGDFPVPVIRIGRRLVFPTAAIMALVGLPTPAVAQYAQRDIPAGTGNSERVR